MKIGSAFAGGDYLKAADLNGRSVKVVIESLTQVELGDESKPVLHFVGKDKGLVLNKTNAAMITEVLGTDETDDWAGATITLYATKVDFQGKRVDGIRVQGGAPVKKESITDEDVPF